MSDDTGTDQPQEVKKKVLSAPQVKLRGVPRDGGRAPTLEVSIWNGMPKFVVWSSDGKPIEARMGPGEFYMVTEAIRQAVASADKIQFPLTCAQQDKDSGQINVTSTLVVGKRADGTVYIGIKSANSENEINEFTFDYNGNRFHTFNIKSKAEGQNTAAVVSCMAASAYARMIEAFASREMYDTYVPYKPTERKFGGNGGGQGGGKNWSRGGGGGGGYRSGGGGGGGFGNRGGGGYPRNNGGGQGGGGNSYGAPKAKELIEDDVPY